MGLKNKVEKIAIAEATRVANEIARALLNEMDSKTESSSGIGKVVRQKSANEFVVIGKDGNEATLTYFGDRPVGPGGRVIIDGDTCR